MAYFGERIDEGLVNGLISNLMAADNKRVAKMLNALIDDNDIKLNGYNKMCFRHGEVMYYHEEYQRGGFSNTYMTPILHKDLRDRFEVIEQERLILKEHTQKIKQILTVLLIACLNTSFPTGNDSCLSIWCGSSVTDKSGSTKKSYP